MTPTFADLRVVLRADGLTRWLGAVEGSGVSRAGRNALARVIEHDRRLWVEFPDSLASSLLARTLDAPGLEVLRAAWLRETEAAGKPWIRPLAPLPLPAGLLATLSHGEAFDPWRFERVSFPDEETVALESGRLQPSFQAPKQRLRWTWRSGVTARAIKSTRSSAKQVHSVVVI